MANEIGATLNIDAHYAINHFSTVTYEMRDLGLFSAGLFLRVCR